MRFLEIEINFEALISFSVAKPTFTVSQLLIATSCISLYTLSTEISLNSTYRIPVQSPLRATHNFQTFRVADN